MEIVIIVLLIVLNGLFSGSETAVISSRKARLQQLADKGDNGAKTALEMAQEPTRFLSTVQVGITLIGILTGAFGGATIAEQIAEVVRTTPLAAYADAIGFGVVVAVTTYLSLIIGELVPKRLALQYPERIAATIAPPMNVLSKITSPLISFLSGSTHAVLLLLGVRDSDEPPVTEEEIKTMMQQGIEAGVFEEGEQEMVSGIFRLGELRVGSLMTPRTEIIWLNLRDTEEENRAKIQHSPFSRLPVCDGDMDHVIGVLNAKTMLSRLVGGGTFDIEATMVEAQFTPATTPASKVIDRFRETAQHIAIVIDEYGGMEGLVTIQDILEEIVGDVEETAPQATQREDKSWLVDGLMSIDDFKDLLVLDDIPGEHERFETLGGFMMAQVNDIPKTGDNFDWKNLHFEVMDMDGNRVDKVLVTTIEPPEEPTESSGDETDETRAVEKPDA
ncbi:MAG: HlyC/CorC family transporter [Anaerolineae bacterium]|nr:HlyC/CorC family transporter [Anaerolineae bacterium]